MRGKYKHFKGNIYKVLYVAKDSETLEDLVIYQATYGNKQIWVRKLVNFNEKVRTPQGIVSRFTKL